MIIGIDKDPQAFFDRLRPEELLKWKGDYERILARERDSENKVKMPWMVPAWTRGLEMVNNSISKQKVIL